MTAESARNTSDTVLRPGVSPPYRSSGAWGIEPVNRDQRRLGFWHYAILWACLGVSLREFIPFVKFVHVEGLFYPVLEIFVGSLVVAGGLALFALAGSDTGVPTMVLLRPVLGLRGSQVVALVIVLALVGLGTAQIAQIAQKADAITLQLGGDLSRLFWVLPVGCLCTILAVAGPVTVVRHWLGKFALWGLLGITAWLAYGAAARMAIGGSTERPSDAILFWVGLALYIGFSFILSLPIAADVGRFAASGGRAFWGTAVGFLAGNLWWLGLMLLDSVGRRREDLYYFLGTSLYLPRLPPLPVLVAGPVLAFAWIYSAALSVQNVFPPLRQRWLAAGLGAACTVLPLWSPMEEYAYWPVGLVSFLVLPLVGIFVADYFLLARRRYDLEDVFQRYGPYWFRGGFRWQGFVALGAGVAVLLVAVRSGEDWSFALLLAVTPAVAFAVHLVMAGRSGHATARATGGGSP